MALKDDLMAATAAARTQLDLPEARQGLIVSELVRVKSILLAAANTGKDNVTFTMNGLIAAPDPVILAVQNLLSSESLTFTIWVAKSTARIAVHWLP